MKALIDGDVVAYRVCHHADKIGGDEDDLFRIQRDMVADWTAKAGCQAPLVCLSNGSHRYKILSTYKAKRPEKPPYLEFVRKVLEHSWPSLIYPGIEADDIMGIQATKYPDHSVIVSVDKDLLQIPGLHYNPDHHFFGVFAVEPERAEYNFYTQWLTGDPVDNYKGIPKVGPAKAEAILNVERTSYLDAVLCAYYERGLTYAYCTQQAQLAYIARSPSYEIDWSKRSNLLPGDWYEPKCGPIGSPDGACEGTLLPAQGARGVVNQVVGGTPREIRPCVGRG